MKKKSIYLFTLILFLFSGCANVMGGISINTYGQVCVNNGSKINLHDLIKKVSFQFSTSSLNSNNGNGKEVSRSITSFSFNFFFAYK